MSSVNKQENILSCYLIVFSMIALAIIALVIVGLTNRNCWDQYQSENAAIEHCEQHP